MSKFILKKHVSRNKLNNKKFSDIKWENELLEMAQDYVYIIKNTKSKMNKSFVKEFFKLAALAKFDRELINQI